MYNHKGKLKNLHKIYADGAKRTLTGVSTKGLFHPIGTGNTERIWIVEGWATGVSVHLATGHDILVAFGCSNLRDVAEHANLLGKRVAICGDTGDMAVSIAEEAAAAIGGDLFVPQLSKGDRGVDANDLAQKRGLKQLQKQIEKNTQPIPTPPSLVEVAASLSRKRYRKCRSDIAERLGISVRDLDSEVQQRKQELVFEEPDPWPEPVDGIELLVNIETLLNRHVSLPDYAATAVVLWTILTYLIDEIYTAAILAINSPEMRCGKTTLLAVLGRLVFRPLSAANISPAATFRMIEFSAPTLLIDEGDSFLKHNEELRGILNSGHERDTAYVVRCVGDDSNPVRFSTFGAKAIALIGTLPSTLADRSILVPMRRKLPDDRRRRLKRSQPDDAFHKLRRQITRWVEDNGDGLDKVRIHRTAGLNDRAFDNWLPLLQIAKRIGGGWQDKSEEAALAIAAADVLQEDSAAVLLLQDLQALFDREGKKGLATALILHALHDMDERPWTEYRRGDPITPPQLASLLRRFRIRPNVIRIRKDRTARGYRLKDCKDAFARYCK